MKNTIKESNLDTNNEVNKIIISEENEENNNILVNEPIKEEKKESSKNSIIININDEAKTYFNGIAPEEEYPIILDVNTNIRYYNLENIFNTFYPADSLNIAKDISREERIRRKIKDPSFTYGEIVY